jgi:glycosyltransferase involved in cell wall biosynthesis
MDYDPPFMHGSRWRRRIEERVHIDFHWARHVARRVRTEGFDTVITMSERMAVPLGMLLPRDVRLITGVVGVMAPRWLRLIRLLGVHKRWSRILTFSHAEAEALARELSLGPDRFSCQWGYYDRAFFKPSPNAHTLPADAPIVSQGLTKRDYPTLIRAMASLPHIPCEISARSAWMDAQAGYEGMQIPSNIRLTAHNHPLAIREALEQCRFAVIPLRPDSGIWSVGASTVLQAQAMGKPVVCTRLPGIADYVEDGVTGILVPPGDPDAMAEAIDSLWRDPARVESMGRAAASWASASFELNNWLERMEVVLGSVARAEVPLGKAQPPLRANAR